MVVGGNEGFPVSVSSLRKVPGIGEYTAGAIASIAFKEAVPVVDGNVQRVLARLRAISANPKDSLTVKKFWKLAAQLVDTIRPGDFNQSLMELGAILCTPVNPSCSVCPISDQCLAYNLSKEDNGVVVTDYPAKSVKVKQRNEISFVCVVQILGTHDREVNQTGKFLMIRRPDRGLLAGLWEFPSVKVKKDDNLPSAMVKWRKAMDCYLRKEFRLESEKTCSIVHRKDVGDFIHIFTHIRLKIYVELLVLRLKDGNGSPLNDPDAKNESWKCVDSLALSSLGLTTGVRKVYNLVQQFVEHPKSQNCVPTKRRSSRKIDKNS